MAELPASQNASATPDPERARVLIVDDTPSNLVALRAILDDPKFDVVEVRSGEEALERARQEEFAAVLLDVRMPGLSGYETAKMLRADERMLHTPLILFTADDVDQKRIEEGFALGAIDFLAKPFSPVVVQAKVKGFVRLFEEKARARREADQLRLLIHGTADYAIFMLDPQGYILTWNAGAERIKGYRAEEIIGRHFSNFYPDEANNRGWPAYELKVATAEGRFEDEGWRVRKDGTQFWANVVITALRDEKGVLRGFSKVTRDLTERKSAEEILRRSEERFRLMIESVQDYAIFMLDPQGVVASWNAGAERIKQYKAEEIIGRHFSTFYPPADLARGWPAHELEVAKREGRFEDEGWRVRKDGTQFWANVVITALRDQDGRLHGFAKVTRDLTSRKQAEEGLRRSEERFRLLVEGAKDYAIFLLDQRGLIASWNAGAERFKGYKAEEIIGQHFSKFYTQEAIDRRWPEHELEVAQREGRFEDEGWRIRKDGTQFWANVVITALRDKDGNLIGFSKITRDMTDRKNAEENARRLLEERTARRVAEENARLIEEQRERLRVTLTSIGDAVISTDGQGHVEFLNPVAQNLVGWTNAEAALRSLEEVFHIVNETTRRPVENPAMRALREGKIVGLANHTILISKDGTEWPIDDSAAPILDSDGKPVGSVLVFRDISDRKRSERTARLLADASAALAVLVDFDSTLQKVAALAVPSFADWATVDLVEQDGGLRRVAVAHVDPSKVELAQEVHRRFPPDPMAAQGVVNIVRTGKSELVAHITDELLVQSVRDKDLLRILRELGLRSYIGVPLKVRGKTIGAITFIVAESDHRYDSTDLATAQDLADRAAIAIENAQLYRELREADRRKDEFLATLAHELRNPLAPIRNGLEVLRLTGGGAGVVEEARSMMERQLGQMVRLVDDLLDVGRITRNKLELRKERVALADVIHSAVETSRPLIEQAGHTLSLTLPPTPVYLDADLTRLAQVFSNLLNNSAKYTERGGHISLAGEVVGNDVVVHVRDNGLGIPPEAMPVIFQLFSQVDRNIERAQGGLGIGLALVRRLAEMHGGQVEACSDGPGRGSEFTVRLPILRDAPLLPANSTMAHSAAVGAAKKILVVDDNQDSAMSLGMMLRLMGNETRLVHDGVAAVAAAEEFRPDMILLDIGLPLLNGYEVCRRIREQPWAAGTVIVALTGWGQEEDRRRSQEAGFDHHLVKPVDIAALEKLLSVGVAQSSGSAPNNQHLQD